MKCCRCCEAAIERGEDIDHELSNDCPCGRCDYCQPWRPCPATRGRQVCLEERGHASRHNWWDGVVA